MNDRLQIAAMAMQTLLKRAKKPFTFQEIAHDALGYADALIAAAGEGESKDELKELALWMTGCGYDFTQHPYFMERRHLLGGTSEKPTSHSEPIKSNWSLRKFFELQREGYEFGVVRLSIKEQDEICDLVDKHYGNPKSSVPRVGELKDWIYDNVEGNIDSIQAAEDLHAWLTERVAK